jgi:hypothetical protein
VNGLFVGIGGDGGLTQSILASFCQKCLTQRQSISSVRLNHSLSQTETFATRLGGDRIALFRFSILLRREPLKGVLFHAKHH